MSTVLLSLILFSFIFLFDETNNIRSLNISETKKKLNDNEFPFVLGGIYITKNYNESNLKNKLFKRFEWKWE